MKRRFLLPALAMAASFLAAQTTAPRPLETLLLLPEPKVLGKPTSFFPQDAEQTVFSPARELDGPPGIMAYSEKEFQSLGLSITSFAERAAKTAERRLATLKPDIIRDDAGKVLYAVYRDEKPLVASLIVAPSLPAVFEKLFGGEIWVVIPDRHSLFVFPPRPEALHEFAADLSSRYATDPRAASPEIFAIKKGGRPRVVASLVPVP